ncbi:MAG: SsrA-binding protein SmpB [Clostridia bacterium]|nr:SsrA-binding protein SmpB [Clostridia bacterium]MBR2449524.1 SsrA-binding protein SmpB [Clostridia bacterium]
MEEKVICTNRAANHEYFILDRLEAGIVLEGGEVKSLRLGNVNLKDSFCVISGGELFIKNMHIALYDKSGAFNTKDSRRDRKLLMHKNEIIKVGAKITQKGLTLVPLKLYFKQSIIKMELGVCQGKHTYDKKRSIMEKDVNREKERELKNYR